MLNEELQKNILKFFYKKWLEDMNNLPRVGEISGVEVDERTLYANADYLVAKNLIETASNSMYATRITIFGIIDVESRELSIDYRDRINVLEYLEEFYNNNPDRDASKGILVKNLELKEEKVERVIWYLEHLGYIDVRWYAGEFDVKITARGMDYLKEPKELEVQAGVMANAYILLYELENELRFFYERVLREEFGEDWWEQGVSMPLRRKAEGNKDKENGNFGLMHYTDFEDLKLIPNKNWTLFEPVLKTQQGIMASLNELEPIRHKLAHTRLLTNDEIAKLEVFYKEILRMLEEA